MGGAKAQLPPPSCENADWLEKEGGGPGLPPGGDGGGGGWGESGPGGEPASILTQMIRSHPEWDERWAESLAISSGTSLELTSPRSLQTLQTDCARLKALELALSPTLITSIDPDSAIVHLVDDFGTSAIVRFGASESARVELLSARGIPNYLDALLAPKRLLNGLLAPKRLTLIGALRLQAIIAGSEIGVRWDKIPIPVVHLPPPEWEELSGTLQAVNVRRGDGLVIDDHHLISVATCARVRSQRGILTCEHGMRTARRVVHRETETDLDRSRAKVNRVWDAAWLPLPNALAWDKHDGVPAPVTCERYREAPGRGLRCSYHGATSGYKVTCVDLVDPILPLFDIDDVARIYTSRITEPGDSGALLVDLEGRALGMARKRTPADYVVPMSMWTYAPGVLAALGADI